MTTTSCTDPFVMREGANLSNVHIGSLLLPYSPKTTYSTHRTGKFFEVPTGRPARRIMTVMKEEENDDLDGAPLQVHTVPERQPLPDMLLKEDGRYEKLQRATQCCLCMVSFIIMQSTAMTSSPTLDVIVLPITGMYVGWHCTRPEMVEMSCVTVPMGLASTAICSILASIAASMSAVVTSMESMHPIHFAGGAEHVMYVSEKCLQTLCMGSMTLYMGGHTLRSNNVFRVLLIMAIQMLLCVMMAVIQV